MESQNMRPLVSDFFHFAWCVQASSVWPRISASFLFVAPLCGCTTFCLFFHHKINFISFAYIHRGGIVRSYGNSIFNSVKDGQTALQKWPHYLIYTHQSIRGLKFLHMFVNIGYRLFYFDHLNEYELLSPSDIDLRPKYIWFCIPLSIWASTPFYVCRIIYKVIYI